MRAEHGVPGNKLSAHEERRLLHVLTSPEYRDLSPRQVIEQGTYIANEATAYRVLHKHDMQKHRADPAPAVQRMDTEQQPLAPRAVFADPAPAVQRMDTHSPTVDFALLLRR